MHIVKNTNTLHCKTQNTRIHEYIGYGSMNEYQKEICLKEIGLCAQNLLTYPRRSGLIGKSNRLTPSSLPPKNTGLLTKPAGFV